MASFLTSMISLLSLSAVVIKSYPLDNICKQTKNPDFCFDILRPHSNANLQEVEQIVIDSTLSRVTETSARIQSDLPKIKDPNLIVVYSLCSNYYSAALSALNAAKEKVKLGEYADLNTAANIVSMDASSCQKAFAIAPSHPIPIANDNNTFDLLSSIFIVVSRILSASV